MLFSHHIESNEQHSEPSFTRFGVELHEADLETLNEGEMVNDTIITMMIGYCNHCSIFTIHV